MMQSNDARSLSGATSRLSHYGFAALAAVVSLVLFTACASHNKIQADPKLPELVFHTSSSHVARLGVEIENTEALRESGLMNVKSMPADQGQIFIFQDAAPNQDVQAPFWMKDTLIPLSIAFISTDGHVQEIQDMQAETLDYHIPQRPYRYAVEANLGWYSRHGIDSNSTVDLSAVLHQ